MCGFAGVVLATDGARTPEVERALVSASEVLSHRGPDDHGLNWCGPCGMAHRRLSVIDLSRAGHQPMGNAGGTVWISYNGEVYNFRELRIRFRLDDKYQFESRTDTEVLLHLYEELGPGFLEHLNGMYSLAIWDSARNRLLLARDPFGIKPLFHTATGDGFWFASEIKGLLQVPGMRREPDPRALFHYLAFDYVPDTLTPFAGIEELAPGTVLEVEPERGMVRSESFTRFSYRPEPEMTEEKAVRKTRAVLKEAVGRHLISDVPVGVMLSGGMDSSALAAMMAMERGDPDFHTFSLAFDQPSFDESSYASLVARQLGTVHHEIRVTPEKVAALLPGYLAHIDEPYGDGSAIPTWLLSGEASSFVTVLLSGEGGDEVFAGYDTHAALKARKLYRRMAPGFLRRGLVRPLVRMLPVSHRKLSFDFKAKRFTAGAELGVPESHFAWRAVLTGDARRSVFGGSSDGYRPSEDFFREIYDSAPEETDLSRILRIDTCTHLPNDLMIKNDRMTMAHSLEARVPFTDMELFRTLSRVPDGIKLPGMRKKNILRKAMEGILPREVLRKKKVGLEMPYSAWFRGELKEMAHDSIFSSGALTSGLLREEGVRGLWDHHQEKRRDNGRALWGILNYALWYDLYVSSEDYLGHIRKPEERS